MLEWSLLPKEYDIVPSFAWSKSELHRMLIQANGIHYLHFIACAVQAELSFRLDCLRDEAPWVKLVTLTLLQEGYFVNFLLNTLLFC